MNVYKIGELWIGAKTADQAFGIYLEDYYVDEPVDGSVEEINILVNKLTNEQIETPEMYCCDGNEHCSYCKGKEEAVLLPLKILIDKYKEEDFPLVLAKEES